MEGHSSIDTRCAIQSAQPFAATWLIEREDRSDRLVLEANRDHWNTRRGPRLERVVFRNDLSPAEALERCISGEGEVDIVTEVSPADAERVRSSEYADLVAFDANRVLVGIFNRHPRDVDLDDRRLREAINLAVDRDKLIARGLGGYANPLPALTPPWCAGFPAGLTARAYEPARARELLEQVAWPEGRALVVAAPEAFAAQAALLAADLRDALSIAVDVVAIPEEEMLAGARMLVEKKLAPPWDVLLHAWFDLSSEVPPAAVHREFFGADGAFRAGPPLPEFDVLYSELVTEVDEQRVAEAAARIDRHCHEECLALFLCAPQSLTAVNRHVRFTAYRTTFELAECQVDADHWSRRS